MGGRGEIDMPLFFLGTINRISIFIIQYQGVLATIVDQFRAGDKTLLCQILHSHSVPEEIFGCGFWLLHKLGL